MTDVVLRRERHLGHRTGWLRAAVLGANDGIVSVAAIIVGVAAARGAPPARGTLRVVLWGIAAMVLTMVVGRAVGTAV
jgi:VIT1/CCC1 family predicted Fe2+/Mn2+ transporter